METLTVKACRETRLCVYWFVGEKSRQETKTDGYCARLMGETLTFGSAGCTHSLYYNSAYGTALVLNFSIETLLANRDSSPGVRKPKPARTERGKEPLHKQDRTGRFRYPSVDQCFIHFFLFLQHQSVYRVCYSLTGRQHYGMSCSVTSHRQNKRCVASHST